MGKKAPSSKTKVTSLSPSLCYLREDAISSSVVSLITAEVPNALGARVAFKVVWTESISSAEGSCGRGSNATGGNAGIWQMQPEPGVADKQTHLCKWSWITLF